MQRTPVKPKIPAALKVFDTLPDSAIVRLPVVICLTGLGKTSVYRLEKEGKFPSRVRIGANSVGWPVGPLRVYLQNREVQS